MGSISKNMNGIAFEKGKEYLKDFQCRNCNLFLDDKDISQENYSFWFSDYANEIKKEPAVFPLNKPTYMAIFWLRGIDHQKENCPETIYCENCKQSYRAELKKCPNC